MNYRGNDFQYDDETGEVESEAAGEQQANKQYRRKRSLQAKRKSTKKPVNKPGCGIGARRNNRWTW